VELEAGFPACISLLFISFYKVEGSGQDNQDVAPENEFKTVAISTIGPKWIIRGCPSYIWPNTFCILKKKAVPYYHYNFQKENTLALLQLCYKILRRT